MKPSSRKDRFQQNLLRWFRRNARDLPWRRTRDPYAIWVSEIMLQQTQVDTVIPYYNRFLKAFPTVRRLAKADLSEVLKLWEGLGYYSRARNLHQASRKIASRFKGKIPDTVDDLLGLPGIGRYTAGAILSIAFDKEAPILDGNVKRVLSRAFAISGNPAKRSTQDLLWDLSESLIPKGHASSFNQALMDLGATVCTPTDPYCRACPLRRTCRAKAEGEPEAYPARKKKRMVPSFDGVVAVIRSDGKVLIHQRPLGGLLGGLWEFPNWRMNTARNPKRFLKERLGEEIDQPTEITKSIGTFQQTFSHFKLTLHVYMCESSGRERSGWWVRLEKLSFFPMSRLHRRIAETIGEKCR